MKKVFLLMLGMFMGLFTYAQSETVVNVESKKGPYITNRFFSNWFISVGGGAQVYMGEDDSYGPFEKRLAPALDASLGKWITPVVGMRFQYSGLEAKGWTEGKKVYSKDLYKENYYNEKFNVMNLHADVLFNISNAIGGYREDRFWDVIPYAGFGMARSWKNSTSKNELAATVGILNTMRISNAFDVNLEAKMLMVNSRLNKVIEGNGFESMLTLTAGITYNFPGRGFGRAADLIVIEDNSGYINTISDLKRKLDKANSARESMAKQLDAERAKAPKVVEIPYPVISELAVFFTIGKADLSEKEMVNLGYVANVIKSFPEETFVLFASADKDTGTPKFNQKLSEKRGQAVYDVLTKKYGVNPSQLKMEAVGDSNQRFKGAQLNRVVVIEDEK